MATNTRTEIAQKRFLDAFAKVGTITHAAKIAGTSSRNHWRWLDDDDYRQRFEVAKIEAREILEDEAIRRAIEGTERPIYQGGRQVGTVTDYSDTLLIFLLKGFRPDKYRDRVSTEVTGSGGGPLTVKFVVPDGYQRPAAGGTAANVQATSLPTGSRKET